MVAPALDDLAARAAKARAWPFEEARKVLERVKDRAVDLPVVFETGYGPSGLPHIGTFGEVVRTTMVRHAFEVLTGGRRPTRLVCFSDDMDGMRKVPDNVPNRDSMARYVEVRDQATNLIVRNPTPLNAVPDPFSDEHPSFGAANNARLRTFLDRFGFDYEFLSSTDCYRSGRFDAAILALLERHDQVRDIVLPSLGPERQRTYSPFLPIVEEWKGERRRQILHHAVVVEARPASQSAIFQPLSPVTGEPDGLAFEHRVTGGHCKLQWRADWAMRWFVLGVDYEMSGKDLIDSAKISGRICRAIGGTPPDGFHYELFLDEKGEKISKSKGNGLTIDEWLAYAPPESLSLFMYQKPRTAKRLYFDVIPRAVDDYHQFLEAYQRQDDDARLANPVWHIHAGAPPAGGLPVSFAMLLNLVSASNAQDRELLWGFIARTAPGVTPETHPELDRLVGYAIRYFDDFVAPTKAFRAPDDVERAALESLDARLARLPAGADAEAIQTAVLDVARAVERYRDPSRKGPDGGPGVSGAWFAALYQILLGQERGPRFGSFVAIYGIAETRALIGRALQGELVGEHA